MRISKDDYYLGIAEAVSKRSNCLRRQYGAVIVKNDEIIATGYNGSPRGFKHCETCGRKNEPRGTNYSNCPSVHAEANAIISASRLDMIDATLYLACNEKNAIPCDMCRRLIINSGISKVITREGVFNVSEWIENPYDEIVKSLLKENPFKYLRYKDGRVYVQTPNGLIHVNI